MESVILRIANVQKTIPAGSFTRAKNGVFGFQGIVEGSNLNLSIKSTKTGFELQAVGSHADFSTTTLPVPVGLAIGDDIGTTVLTKLVADSQ